MKQGATRFYTNLLLMMLLSGFSIVRAGDEIAIQDAWIREAPPGAHALAGYARIQNNSSSDIYLQGVESNAFGMAMIHMTRTDEQHRTSMHHMDSVKIPANSSVELQPGGMHIMLMRPERQLRAGDKAAITLNFSNGSARQVQFVVERK